MAGHSKIQEKRLHASLKLYKIWSKQFVDAIKCINRAVFVIKFWCRVKVKCHVTFGRQLLITGEQCRFNPIGRSV